MFGGPNTCISKVNSAFFIAIQRVRSSHLIRTQLGNNHVKRGSGRDTHHIRDVITVANSLDSA